MQEEYNYTLTVPLADIKQAEGLIQELKTHYPVIRISRKPDTKTHARFYLSFPFSGTRSDTRFQEFIQPLMGENWDLFGPNYGIWGLK